MILKIRCQHVSHRLGVEQLVKFYRFRGGNRREYLANE